MKIIDKVKDKIGLGKDNGDGEEPVDISDRPTVDPPAPSPLPTYPHNNVIDFSAFTGAGAKEAARRMNVVIVTPASFDDAQEIANSIKGKKPVVVNFENTDSEIAKRIVDFISGTTYALGGEMKKVGRNVFFCAPNNVDVSFNKETNTPAPADNYPWMKK